MISVLLFAGAMLLRALLGVGVMFLLPVEWIDSLAARYWTPSTSAVAAEVDRLTHDWVSAFGERVVNAVGAQLWMLTTDRLWRMTAMMCLGMALLQLGFLSGRWSMRAYGRVVVLGLGIGMPVVLLGVGLNEAAGWDFAFSWFLGRIFNHWGSVAISLAWLAGGIMLVKSGALQRTLSALQAVGRMALTNYLGQSLICGAIFYGFGLGLFSQLSHVELLGVVILVWAFQIAFSLLWQRHLGRGPFERVWRHLARSR